MHPIALVSWLHADVRLSPSRTQAGQTHTKNSPVTALAAHSHCTLRTPSPSRYAPQQIPSLFDTHRLSHAKATSDLPLFCRLDARTRKHLRNSSTIYFHRNNTLTSEKERSWFGPNGQYIRELPCPSCRGRGYTPCPECGVDRTRPDCFQCTGKGVTRCWQCLGECVIWEESYDERPWEKVLSSSLFKVKEDDEVDSLDIKVDATRKSKRVYRTLTPEVSLKISRSLRNLNAKTGLFSKRMKIIHQDPVLHGQRVAAIKKAKGTPAARKRASDISKAYFTNPEHRLKRSMAMKGVKFYCSHCGEEGHRRHYCQVLRGTSTEVRFRCSLCGVRGHNLRTCGRTITKKARTRQGRPQHFKLCSRTGRYRAPFPELIKLEEGNTASQGTQPAKAKRAYSCKLCLGKGHNSRTCPTRKANGETSTSISVPEQQTLS